MRSDSNPELSHALRLLPAYERAVREVSKMFFQAGIRHALVGALGANAYRDRPRTTADIDFLVGDEAFEKHAAGFVTMRVPVVEFDGIDIDQVPLTEALRVIEDGLDRAYRSEGVPIFDENGTYLSEWKIAVSPSSLHFVQIGADRTVATFDRNTHKMLKYDLDGRLIYSWGTVGDFPGTLWGVHGMSTDQEGNLYVAEVDAGRFQKFRPRPGANPAMLIGKPVYSAWK